MRRYLYAATSALMIVAFTFGQISAQLNIFWEEAGPNNMGNHTRAMLVDGNGDVWAGSVGGGLWKSTNQGFTWSQVTGLDGTLAVSSIAASGNRIYVGTGEKLYFEPDNAYIGNFNINRIDTLKETFHQFSGQPGEGVYVSTDGGMTWDHDNATWGPSNPPYEGVFSSIQKVATNGSRTFIATVEGMYWSDNADLSTVTKCTGSTDFEGDPIVDVEFAAGNVVLAATQDTLYRSTNGGASFISVTDSIPVGTTPPNNRFAGDRVEIEVAPSDPNICYVAGASGINGNCTGVWRSTDAGENWVRIAPFESATFQPFQGNGLYSLVLAVPPNDPLAVVLGGEKLYKYSENTGWNDAASHSNIPGFTTDYVPTPMLSIAFDPTTDSTLYIGTDQEIVRSTDLSGTYSIKTKGFNNASLYGVSPNPDFSLLLSDRYMGLLYRVPDSANKQEFTDIYSAAATRTGIARFTTTNPNYIIGQGADGGLVRSFNKGEAFEQFYGVPIEPIHPSYGSPPDSIFVDRANATSGSGGLYDVPTLPVNAWCLDEYIPPTALSNDTSILETPIWLYLCSRHFVWVCTNPFGGVDSLPNWNRITPDLVQDFFGNGQREYYSAIAVSGDADHVVYVGTNTGKLFRIEDANDPLNMDLTTKIIRVDTMQTFAMPNRWISDIEFAPGDPNNLIVTYGSYAKGDDRVFVTNNAKAASPTFRSIQSNLPADLPVYTAAFHPDANVTAILLGTDEGVYGTDSDYGNASAPIAWSRESTNIGTVPVTDIAFRRYYLNQIDPDNYSYAPDYRVFVATHGRGAFKSSTLVNRPEETTASAAGIKMDLAPNPTEVTSTIQLQLDRPTKVTLEAYNLEGRRIALIRDRRYPTGNYNIPFDVSDLPTGVYLVKGIFSNSQGISQKTMKQVVVK
ncbi:MAG: T9SS type A sorting domain-containing protein [Bacteroidota bacterium]